MKKGFTLIELLAVIIILALIFLIVVPRVNKSISYSKEEGIRSSVTNAYNAAEEYYYSQDGIKNRVIDLMSGTIKLNGEIEKGEVSYDASGNISIYIYNDSYCAKKSYDSDITVTKINKEECGF